MKPCNHRVVATTSQLIEKPGRQVILTNLIGIDLYFQTQLWWSADESRWSLSYLCPTLPCGFSTPSRQVALMPTQWWYTNLHILWGHIILGSNHAIKPTWGMRVSSNSVLCGVKSEGGKVFTVQTFIITCFQVEFYGGSWAWPMISHISMPLAIFYRYLDLPLGGYIFGVMLCPDRFHSTVCLFEIWKKTFKFRSQDTILI